MQSNNVSCEKMKFSQLAALHLLRLQANDFAIRHSKSGNRRMSESRSVFRVEKLASTARLSSLRVIRIVSEWNFKIGS